jgi:hypothetical protein
MLASLGVESRVHVTSRRQAISTAMDTLYKLERLIGKAMCFVLNTLCKQTCQSFCVSKRRRIRSLVNMTGCNTACLWNIELRNFQTWQGLRTHPRDVKSNVPPASGQPPTVLLLKPGLAMQSLFNGLRKWFAVWPILKSAVAFRVPNNGAAFIRDARPTMDTSMTRWEKRDALNYTFMLPHCPKYHTKQPKTLAKPVILYYCIYPASSCPLWQTSASLH